MASQSSGAVIGPSAVDFVKDTYIPIFTDRPGDYKEWRKRILLYKKKSDINKKSKEATINLMTSLNLVASPGARSSMWWTRRAKLRMDSP